MAPPARIHARRATHTGLRRSVRRGSDLAGGAVEGRAAAPLGPLERGPAPRARLALPGVHLVLLLVAAGLAVEVDVLLVGQAAAAGRHRFVHDLDDGPEQ